jgi:nucleotide-binding universal stress UspA family protein
MTRTTIVVGVDGAWHRTGAVAWASAQAFRSADDLQVVHVVDDRYARLAAVPSETVGARAQDLIASVRKHLRESGATTNVTADAMVGTPGVVLAEVARSARMVVVGRRGVGGFTRLLIGSTSENVVNHADVPVVVVPDGWKPEEHTGAPVVAGVDVSAPSDAALEFAFARAAERSVPLRLLHLWDPPAGYVWETGFVSDELRTWHERSRAAFDEVIATWRDKHPDVAVEPVLEQGHPVAGLVEDAAATGAQLIVVGGRRHGRLTGFVLGSVARGVLHHARCPLAVVHDSRTAAAI